MKPMPAKPSQPFISILTATLFISCVLLVGCAKEEKKKAERPPIDVTAMTLTAQDTPINLEYVAQTQSSREVEIRARVEGFLEKRLYTEGELVREGQKLFEMDRKPFEAALQSAKGQLAQQKAALTVATANLARVRPLAAQNAVSQKDLDDAIGEEQKSRAAVFAAEGQVHTAELDLSYTTIYSPLTGLSSYARQQEGSYLSPATSLLTTVAQVDPIWINFSVSENEILKLREEVAQGALRFPKDDNFDVEIVLADGSVYPEKGKINFIEPSFSKETGTFLIRSVFANPKGSLRPGQFVKAIVQGAVRLNAIQVPQRAVQQGAKSHFVWVVNKSGKGEERVVDVGSWIGDNWFIDKGLRAGEQVVVDGAIRVAQGASLKVSPYNPAEAGSTTESVRTTAEPINPISTPAADDKGKMTGGEKQ